MQSPDKKYRKSFATIGDASPIAEESSTLNWDDSGIQH